MIEALLPDKALRYRVIGGNALLNPDDPARVKLDILIDDNDDSGDGSIGVTWNAEYKRSRFDLIDSTVTERKGYRDEDRHTSYALRLNPLFRRDVLARLHGTFHDPLISHPTCHVNPKFFIAGSRFPLEIDWKGPNRDKKMESTRILIERRGRTGKREEAYETTKKDFSDQVARLPEGQYQVRVFFKLGGYEVELHADTKFSISPKLREAFVLKPGYVRRAEDVGPPTKPLVIEEGTTIIHMHGSIRRPGEKEGDRIGRLKRYDKIVARKGGAKASWGDYAAVDRNYYRWRSEVL